MTPHHKITEILPGDELLGTAVKIGEGDDFAIRHPEPPVCAFPGSRGPVLGPACARVNRFVFTRVRRVQRTQHILP